MIKLKTVEIKNKWQKKKNNKEENSPGLQHLQASVDWKYQWRQGVKKKGLTEKCEFRAGSLQIKCHKYLFFFLMLDEQKINKSKRKRKKMMKRKKESERNVDRVSRSLIRKRWYDGSHVLCPDWRRQSQKKYWDGYFN